MHLTCRWSLRWTPIMPVEGLHRARSESPLIGPHPWLSLGIRGCGNVTLLTHFAGTAVTVFSCQDEGVSPVAEKGRYSN